MKKLWGYLRVSRNTQDVENQKFGILEYCAKHGLKIEGWIYDTATGKGDAKKRKIWPLLYGIAKGDRLIASEISRIGRSTYDTIGILKYCIDNDITFTAVKENRTFGNDLDSKIMAFALALAAEIEGARISQRTKESIAYLKSKNAYYGGRPDGVKNKENKLDPHKEKIVSWIQIRMTDVEIAFELKVHRHTVRKYIKENKLRVAA